MKLIIPQCNYTCRTSVCIYYKCCFYNFQIDIDCDTLFQNKNSIYNDFQTKSEKFFNIFESKINDLNGLKILDQIKNGSDINESKY